MTGANEAAAVSDLARTIQLAVAPAFLLVGIGGILQTIANRLNRVVDRSRLIAELHPGSSGIEHDMHVWELRLLDRRITLASHAIFLCVAAAVTVCAVVILIFAAQLLDVNVANVVAGLFGLSMLLLAAGLVVFLVETRIAVGGIHVPEALLEREQRGKRRFAL